MWAYRFLRISCFHHFQHLFPYCWTRAVPLPTTHISHIFLLPIVMFTFSEVNCFRNLQRSTTIWKVCEDDNCCLSALIREHWCRRVCGLLQQGRWHPGSLLPPPRPRGGDREWKPSPGVPWRHVSQHSKRIFSIKARENKWKGKWVVNFIVVPSHRTNVSTVITR